jgi:hypothetical protein
MLKDPDEISSDETASQTRVIEAAALTTRAALIRPLWILA